MVINSPPLPQQTLIGLKLQLTCLIHSTHVTIYFFNLMAVPYLIKMHL